MDEISVKDKKYRKAKLVARELGYTNDYIGQLCRAGKIDAELVGRTWYVDFDSVMDHKQTRYRSSKSSTRRELQQHAAKERQIIEAQQSHRPPKIATYAHDETELIPLTQSGDVHRSVTKIPVNLADAKKVKVSDAVKDDATFKAEERKKTKFYGTLKVTDFIEAELPVEAVVEDDIEQSVVVNKAEAELSQKITAAIQPRAAIKKPKHVKNKRSVVTKVQTKTPSITVPVAVEETDVSIPVTYRIAPATAAIVGLALAALLVGFETTTTVTAEAASTSYSFVVDNVSALIFIAK